MRELYLDKVEVKCDESHGIIQKNVSERYFDPVEGVEVPERMSYGKVYNRKLKPV